MDIKLSLGRLEGLRIVRDKNLEILRKRQEEFEIQNEVLKNILTVSTTEIQVHESDIREEALRIFKETGEKKLDFGVGIRVMKKLEYNPDEAFLWGKEHSMALKLDQRAFEKIAKMQDIDFVKTTEEATATIPTKINLEEK